LEIDRSTGNERLVDLPTIRLGVTGILLMAIMLSLLVFIGEGVRDSFDPTKTLSYGSERFCPRAFKCQFLAHLC